MLSVPSVLEWLDNGVSFAYRVIRAIFSRFYGGDSVSISRTPQTKGFSMLTGSNMSHNHQSHPYFVLVLLQGRLVLQVGFSRGQPSRLRIEVQAAVDAAVLVRKFLTHGHVDRSFLKC